MDDLVGQSLGRYRLDTLLGEGGMGAVFKAHDITLQRDVAVKIMHPHIARQPRFRERFLQEARTAARLDHEGIVRVHDFGLERSLLFIVMEFIAGDNLRQMLGGLRANGEWIALDEAVRLVRQVCLALDYAHDAGVLHRDLKPDNIMIKPRPVEGLGYTPVITDLGLAKLAGGGLVTAEGTAMGTPAYMAPEQARGQPTDARTDVYSVGVLLFELAVGRLPFPVRNVADAVRYHGGEAPPRPRSLRPDLSHSLEAVILQALAKEPDRRFRDAGVLAEALAGVLGETAVAESGAAVSTPAGTVSLLTRYQESLVGGRSRSVLDQFPQRPRDLAEDRVTLLMPDGSTKSVSLRLSGSRSGAESEVTFGRAPDCHVQVEDAKASRHHARLTFERERVLVTDLNSTNGTYLGETRLLPGVPEPWAPEVALRIGDTWLRLELAAGGRLVPSSGLFRSDGSAVPASAIRSSVGQGRIGVFVEAEALSVVPGRAATMSLTLINQGPVVDSFRTEVHGVPASWLPVEPPVVRLLPTHRQAITLSFLPPRDPASGAGRHWVTLRVSSADDPREQVDQRLSLEVGAFRRFGSGLHPERIKAGHPAQVTVRNEGNAPEGFSLSWRDQADELAFDPPRAEVVLNAGGAASIEFRGAPRRRRWIGSAKAHRVTTQVSADSGEVQSHRAEVISRGLIPAWVLPVLLFLCAGLAAGAVLLRQQLNERSAHATQTAEAAVLVRAQEADATEMARIAAGTATAAAATATAAFLQGANQATLAAATATAEWLSQDDDRDGLTNAREIELRTLPGNRDTDADGLADGAEVDETGTDPLDDDSDGDGLKDGDEVGRGLDPNDTDTDDDGLQDAQDPFPACTPTLSPTPTPTYTATPTVSRTPTPTPSLTPTGTSPPPPAIGYFGASLEAIRAGRCVDLQWGSVTNATAVEINLGIGGVGASGSYEVCPAATTTYKLTATGPGGTTEEEVTITVSPSLIAFETDRDGNHEVYTMNPDGSGLTRVTSNPAGAGSPTWSPDGQRIAFYSSRGGGFGIYVKNASGSGAVTQVAFSESWGPSSPAWSPIDERIAFSCRPGDNDEICLVNVDGTGLVNLTGSEATDGLPAWSPDGEQIIFISAPQGSMAYQLHVMNADGTAQAALNYDAMLDFGPSLSPDGRGIAFVSLRDGNREIYVMDVASGALTNLTGNPAEDTSPSWSPDGRHIAFCSDRGSGGDYEIYVMSADGSWVQQLTANDSYDGEPAW